MVRITKIKRILIILINKILQIKLQIIHNNKIKQLSKTQQIFQMIPFKKTIKLNLLKMIKN